MWNLSCYLLPDNVVSTRGLESTVGIATRYGLDGPRIESQCRRDFPHLSRPTLGALTASYTTGTVSFPGVKRPGRGVDHPTPTSALVKRNSKTIPLLHLWAFVVCYGVNFTFTFVVVATKIEGSTLTMDACRIRSGRSEATWPAYVQHANQLRRHVQDFGEATWGKFSLWRRRRKMGRQN
jgi:hypothetical protein